MRELLLTTDVARLLKKSADSVRLYERRGLLEAERTASGVRVFTREAVERFRREHEAQATERRPA